ncbi:MAG: polymerase subunit epsilon [Verrucomicrobiaceae bacterium]|nr:polymerase subunit epsilon [Verrucomicrobiaceae bacterium]
MLQTFAVIDFETTGLSPAHGARPTEVAAVLVRNGQIYDQYHSLMNAGVYVPPMIEALTGISNAMVRSAPNVNVVMGEVAEFVGRYPLVAHNAAFDCKFWDAEFQRLKLKRQQEFICSLLLARRVYPGAYSHKLNVLAKYLGLPAAERYHRALADAQVTAHLLLDIKENLKRRFALSQVTSDLLLTLQKTPAKKMAGHIEKYSAAINSSA